MSLVYTEYDGVTTHTMETEAGTVGGTKRNVHGLAPADRQQLTDINAALVVTNEELEDVNTNLGDIHMAVDAIETKLDSLRADVNPASAGSPFQKSTGATQTQLNTLAVANGIIVKNISTANQIVYVIKNGQATTDGFQLTIGEERAFPCRNADEWYIIASAASANVCVLPI